MRSFRKLFERLKDEFYPSGDEFDRMRHVNTSGRTWKGRMDVSAESKKTAMSYQAVNPLFFYEAIACLPKEALQATFIDLGCGKGRALILAKEAGFTKIKGVEFSSKLASVAKQNVSKDVQVLCGDAGNYKFTDEPVVLFLYNPFGPEVLLRVLENLQGARQVWVMYINPVHADMFTMMFELGSSPAWKVFRRE